jgi:HK97 family phage major capsid protein
MSDTVKRLRDRRLNVWNQAMELADRAADENRAFTAEEQGTWDSLNDEIDKIDERMKGYIEREERDKAQQDKLAAIENRAVEPSKTGGGDQGQASQELRAFLKGDPGAPRFFDFNPSGPVNFRDLLKGTTTLGGFTVPTDFYSRLMAHLIENSGMLQTNPTVLNTGSGENIQVPKTTAHVQGALFAEAAAITEEQPTFGQLTLGAFKYATLLQISRELIQDTGVDLEGYMSMSAGRAIGNVFGAHMITGTGTGQPRGITIDTTLGVTGGAGVAGAFTADNLIDLQYSVISPYRSSQSAAWLMRDATVGAVRKLKDTTGQYLWQPSLVAGAPDLLLSKPIVTDPNVAAVGLAAKSVVFGDFSQYFVRLAQGVRFERSDDFAFNTDLVTFRAVLRADAALVDLTGAVKHFIGNAA